MDGHLWIKDSSQLRHGSFFLFSSASLSWSGKIATCTWFVCGFFLQQFSLYNSLKSRIISYTLLLLTSCLSFHCSAFVIWQQSLPCLSYFWLACFRCTQNLETQAEHEAGCCRAGMLNLNKFTYPFFLEVKFNLSLPAKQIFYSHEFYYTLPTSL